MRGNKVIQRVQSGAPPTRKLRLLALPLAITVFLALSATPAFAAKTHHLLKIIENGAMGPEQYFGGYRSLGVDEVSGNVLAGTSRGGYAIDVVGPEGGVPSGVASPFSIQVYTGEAATLHAGVAVDTSSTSPSKGALYVADAEQDALGVTTHVVKKFVLNPLGEQYELDGTLNATRPSDVAVDSKGNVFIADEGSKSIAKFSPTGTEIGQIPVGFFTGSVAVSAKGDLYVQESGGGDAPLRVFKFAANGAGEIAPGTQPIEIAGGISRATGPQAIALDQSTEELYVAYTDRVEQYDSTGERIGEFEAPTFEDTMENHLIAVNGQTGFVYVFGAVTVAVGGGSRPGVLVFGPTAVAPDATTGGADDVTPTSATLKGSVNAAGGLPATCQFEYTTDASFSVRGFESASSAPCSPAGPFTGTSPEPVSAAIGGLATQTLYRYRLVASSPDGTTRGKTLRFRASGPPLVDSESISGLTTTGATLEALINPASEGTSYVFEYVSEADFNQSGYAKATVVPLGGESIGAGIDDVKVIRDIEGLAPDSNYFFRVLATNSFGATPGPDRFFTTLGLKGFAELPDGRAYEQASPIDKGGANAQGRVDFIKAADDGSGITFFSNGGIPGGEGAQQFPVYLSTRAVDGGGWSTQGVLPPASNGSSGLVRGFSEDLSRTYVTQSKKAATPATFYERDNATHSLRAIGGNLHPTEHHNAYIGSSADGSKALIELLYDETVPLGAAPNSPNTFVWDKATGTLHLAGVLNDQKAPAGGTSAGSFNSGGPLNYTHYEHPFSSDGSRAYFTAMGDHEIYLRENPTQEQSELSGNACTEPGLACTVHVSASKRTLAPLKDEKPATLWNVTPDGSQAFFTSSGKLTNNAKTGPKDEGNDLYRYEAATGQLIDLTVDGKDPNGAEVQGVVGISDEGAYVYFVANGVLAPGAELGNCKRGGKDVSGYDDNYLEFTRGKCNLYLWHEGTITFIAPQQTSNFDDTDSYNWVRKPNIAGPSRTSRVTADGGTLLFRSLEKLTPDNNEGPLCHNGSEPGPCAEFYRYSAEDGDLICVTCNPSGEAVIGEPRLASISVTLSTQYRPVPVQTRNLSADGDRVFFESPDKLVAGDINGNAGCPRQPASTGQVALLCQDVYEWEAKGSGSCHSEAQNGGCLYLLSTGTSPRPSYFADASVSGNDAFFFTDQSLVRQDEDQLADIYDARVGGGIAGQNNPPLPVCEGEACKPAAAIPPASQSPGSANFSATGNPKPVRHHKKKARPKKKQDKKQHKKQSKHRQRSAQR